jgi:hypothetical protein
MVFALLFLTLTAVAQPDSRFTWREYGRTGTTDLTVLPNPRDEERPTIIVLRELAENTGPTIISDARYLAEQIARSRDLDPAAVTWLFHWGAFSYPGGEGRKELFLRATFRRTDRGGLTTPAWRLMQREEVIRLTDRRYPAR